MFTMELVDFHKHIKDTDSQMLQIKYVLKFTSAHILFC